ANTLNIPAALLDRMEVIRLAGYIEDEKLHIAQQHIVPRQREKHGLSEAELSLSEEALRHVIQHYTREAGVRNLEREIAKICRKVVKRLALDSSLKGVEVTSANLVDFLGVTRYRHELAEQDDATGRVTGLAWTEVGGELLTIESAVVPGKGKLIHTGSLGEVMQESIQAALTVVRSRAASLGIDAEFHQKKDIHLHMPEGAIPKDGPSAGIGMVTALVSSLTSIPVRSSVAMTGEITLRGEVLAIGGLKEKLIAAHRGGIKTVLIPHENAKDLIEIPENVKSDLEIVPVRWIDEVLERALSRLPMPEETGVGGIVPMKETGSGESALRSH
ncbi:MAG TPA: endopeptidase La, partial [Gammaproteobacteria bacterium]|nr:endopeptidase La [Gammaproteobacteria bacterium]